MFSYVPFVSVNKTKAPFSYEKNIPTDSITKDLYESRLSDIENTFSSECKFSPVITDDYLVSFECFLQSVNICFSNRFIQCVDSDKGHYTKSISFHEWLDQPRSKDNARTNRDTMLWQKPYWAFCTEVVLLNVGYYPDTNELVVKTVMIRPCAEGLGLYKIIVWQLILICRREHFSNLIFNLCTPENFEILRAYFGFDPAIDRYKSQSLWNCTMSLERMQKIGDNLPWKLENLIEAWDEVTGIKLKDYDSFAYPSQLNNEFYVNEKFRNIKRDGVILQKVNLNQSFYGYPNPQTQLILNTKFSQRHDSYLIEYQAFHQKPFMDDPLLSTKIVRRLAIPPLINVNPVSVYEYQGYPDPIVYTRQYNNRISNSMEEAALHVPIIQGGYDFLTYSNGENIEYLPNFSNGVKYFHGDHAPLNQEIKENSISTLFDGDKKKAKDYLDFLNDKEQNDKLPTLFFENKDDFLEHMPKLLESQWPPKQFMKSLYITKRPRN